MELEKSPAAGCSIFEACGLIERIRPYRLIEDLAIPKSTSPPQPPERLLMRALRPCTIIDISSEDFLFYHGVLLELTRDPPFSVRYLGKNLSSELE